MKIKEENRKKINQLMAELKKEIDTFIDPKDKFDAKAKYVELLWKMSTINIEIETNNQKDSIKEDISKENELEESEELEELAEEITIETEQENNKNNDEENNPLNESEEVIYVTDEEGNLVDVTDAYNHLDFIEDTNEREETALSITQYDCLDEYETLDMLDHSDDKLYLAWCIKECGLDYINECVAELSSGKSDNIFDFINNNNLEGFTEFISAENDDDENGNEEE